MVRQTFRVYYAVLILRCMGLGATFATYASFLLDRGLNLFEVNLVNVAFYVMLALCEIPTGVFADVFGRKWSVVVSLVLLMCSMLVYALSGSIWGFLGAEVLAAIAMTFYSGAFDAWLVDSIRHYGSALSLQKVFSRTIFVKHVSILVSALLGAMLADISFSLAWFLGAFFFAAGAIVAIVAMREEYGPQEVALVRKRDALQEIVAASISYGVRNRNIRFIMLISLILTFSVMAPNMQWQPLFKQWLSAQTYFGFLFLAMSVCLIVGVYLGPRVLLPLFSEKRALVICCVAIGVGIMGSVATTSFPLVFLVFLFHQIARGAVDPLKTAYLHDNIPSKERATIASFESVAHHVGGAVGLLVSGAVAYLESIALAWILSGGILVVLSVSLWKNGK